MKGINKVILIGNTGSDPEVRYFDNNDCVANISIATSEKWKDKTTGEEKEATEWHRVVFRNKLAEIAGEWLKKGQKVYIEGKLKTRKWQDQGGADHYTTEIIAREMQMLGGKQDSQSGSTAAPNQPNNNQPDMGSFDDDIPF